MKKKLRPRSNKSTFTPNDHQLLDAAHKLVSELSEVCADLVEGDWSELSAEDQVKLLGLADAARGLHWAGVGHDWDDAMRQFFYAHGPDLRLAPVTQELMSRLETDAEAEEDAAEQTQ
jgi:hypothetical protein